MKNCHNSEKQNMHLKCELRHSKHSALIGTLCEVLNSGQTRVAKQFVIGHTLCNWKHRYITSRKQQPISKVVYKNFKFNVDF